MTDRPDVSVVMGVCNAVGSVKDTILGVLRQEGVALEFVVVDDGSDDGTSDLLDRLAREDDRLRVIHQANAGLTLALVQGCAAARAPLIARQDAGDISLPGRLRRQADLFAKHPRLAFVSCETDYVDADANFLYRNAGSGQAHEPMPVIDLAERHGVRDGPSHHGSVMFRRDLYESAGGYRPQFYFGQDWDLWYRLAERGEFCLVPALLYRARIAPGDISTTRKAAQEQLAALSLRALHERAAGRSDQALLAAAARVRPKAASRDPAQARRAAAHASYFIGECLRCNGNVPRATHHFRRAIASRPWLLKAWLRLAQAQWSRLLGGS
jgi:glycosyltransferase involved in cell wall biosynthesis